MTFHVIGVTNPPNVDSHSMLNLSRVDLRGGVERLGTVETRHSRIDVEMSKGARCRTQKHGFSGICAQRIPRVGRFAQLKSLKLFEEDLCE